MAKRLLLLHVGPDAVDVSAMTESLSLGGVAVPDVDPQALTYAELEILRTHKAAGLKRKQVEGSWAHVCRRARKTKSDCFVSMPGWFDATPEQAALALDTLAGFRVVLISAHGFTAQPPATWTSLVAAEHTHLLPAHLGEDRLAAQVARIALMAEEARLDKRLTKVAKRRRQVTKRLAA